MGLSPASLGLIHGYCASILVAADFELVSKGQVNYLNARYGFDGDLPPTCRDIS